MIHQIQDLQVKLGFELFKLIVGDEGLMFPLLGMSFLLQNHHQTPACVHIGTFPLFKPLLTNPSNDVRIPNFPFYE